MLLYFYNLLIKIYYHTNLIKSCNIFRGQFLAIFKISNTTLINYVKCVYKYKLYIFYIIDLYWKINICLKSLKNYVFFDVWGSNLYSEIFYFMSSLTIDLKNVIIRVPRDSV